MCDHIHPFADYPAHRRGRVMGILSLLLCLVLAQAAPARADVLYAVEFGTNKVQSFTIDVDGSLHPQGIADTGKQPLTITLARQKRVAFIGNSGSYEITAYDIDPRVS